MPRFPLFWHYHPEFELTYVVSGRGLRFVADSVEEFQDGDLCLIGADTPHCWWSNADQPGGFRAVVIQFATGSLDGAIGSLPELRKIRELLSGTHQGICIGGPTREAVAPIITNLSSYPHGSWERLSAMLGVLLRIADSNERRPLASRWWESVEADAEHEKLSGILDFIHASIGPELKQHHAALHAKMSPTGFAHFFKRSVGKTYVDYVNELKVRVACHALLDSHKTIAEAAYAAGFNNLSHFNSRFRKVMGVSPKEFRLHAEAGKAEIPAAQAHLAVEGIVK